MDKQLSHINDALLQTGRIAISSAVWAALRVFALPWSAIPPETSMWKSTDRPHDQDPTESIDEAARKAITDVLRLAAQTPRHPLSRGFLLHNEETGLHQFEGIGGRSEDLVVFVDPIDYTSGALRGLDGSSLISFYHVEHGLCAAVIGELFRKTIFWRKQDEASKAMTITYVQDPTAEFVESFETLIRPTGDSIPLRPSGRDTLRGSSINIYMGKPERVTLAARVAPRLWSKETGVSEIFSVGGSLGPVRVGQGLWDASIEIAKGFRPWDFMPGAFIAQGAGAVVVDLEGNVIEFDRGLIKEEYIRKRFADDALEECRQTFVVAGTEKLAREIVAKLETEPADESPPSRAIQAPPLAEVASPSEPAG